MTRGDMIRGLDDDALAGFLDIKPFCHPNPECGETYDDCVKCIKKYLNEDISTEGVLDLLER